MKFLVAFTIFAAALVLNVMAKKCPIACTRELNPTGGYNGVCFKKFSSPCMMEHHYCENGEKFSIAAPRECADAKQRCPKEN